MTLKVFADRLSQPSRASIIFCITNGIDFEEVGVELFKGGHKKREYLYPEINPMEHVPTIAHGNFKLFESFSLRAVLSPILGLPPNPTAAAEAGDVLTASLLKLETFWLQGEGRFLVSGSQPSIADLSLVCEIMELEFIDEKECKRILAPHKKVLQWIEDTRSATSPHFDEVHVTLLETKAKFNMHSKSSISVLLSSINLE